MNIFKEIYTTLCDWIVDLRSTRVFLIWIAIGTFIFVVLTGQDIKVILTVAGWMSVVLAFYFDSTKHQAKLDHEKYLNDSATPTAEGDPENERDPDKI
jgi:hypothetical protein